MTLVLTAAERDALYEQVLVDLSGIGDVWLAIEAEDYEAADRLGRGYSDELRLVLDDLRWGPESSASVELTSSPEVLRRVFSRVAQLAAGQRESEEAERETADARASRNRLVIATCRRVLESLAR